ncbi:MAG: gliding motility-associated C-terminal domain-containing protein, partial [Bacteroidetes bacterium]|nr:gliding motility-associated C-terminal domain-containing protein [Bacteroidota bacterium]
EIQISEVLWSNNVTDPRNFDLDAGTYMVTVTAINGCTVDGEANIGIDIETFNGISKNGDGSNEIFEIACISLFPENNVKIFNRTGTLVWEDNGYDNVSIFFEGNATEGLNLIGTDLPDGTYFYVIDKRDGSKPLAGFLELLR